MSDALPRWARSGRAILVTFLSVLLALLLLRWVSSLYVEYLWFQAEGRTGVFWRRTLSEWGARLLIGAASGIFAWFNLRHVGRSFSGIQIQRRVGDLVIREQIPRRYIRWAIASAAVLIGLWFMAAVPGGTGLEALLLVNGPSVGVSDPILGRDLGFHLFRYGFLSGAVTYGMVVVTFVAAAVVAGYTATGVIRWGNGRVRLDPLPRKHLGILLGGFILLLGLRFTLSPHGLLMDGTSAVQGIFGSTDAEARIAGYRMAAFLAFVTAAVAIWGAVKNRIVPAASGAAALGILILIVVQVYPAVIQRFRVEPNELEREAPHIVRAVEATRSGFGLSDLVRDSLDYRPPTAEDWDVATERMHRLPVWTENTLLATFRQIEARFQYYDFTSVTFDRYGAPEGLEPITVAVREVDPEGIAAEDRAWQNLRLRERYITGMGAVAGLLARRTDEGRLPMVLSAIPPEFHEGENVPEALRMTRPQIFVSLRPQLAWAVVSPTESSFLAPDGSPGVPGTDYPTGIPIGSTLRKLIFAWNFQDANLFLADEIRSDARFVYRRDVRSRVQALAPFLRFPETPYAVLEGGRVHWIVEGFTQSRNHPLSVRHDSGAGAGINYVRNSVKATVDAVTGEVRFFAADPDDPVLEGWRRAFPGLIEDLDQMPDSLRSHLRYSRWLLDLQIQVLLRYHQEDPAIFHAQQDRWEEAQELSIGTTQLRYRPEYALLTLPGDQEERWVLSSALAPLGRRNLASFLAAEWTSAGGPVLRLWDLPVEDQVAGPQQVEALIEQDPDISQQFSLWRQGGSQVWTGHLHLVPVGNTLLYMEPVFLAATVDAIPEIRRFVVSDGRRVAMRIRLADAVEAVEAGEAAAVEEEGEPDQPAPTPEGATPGIGDTGSTLSSEALQLLDAAEERLRAGDWEGFGARLRELRLLLEAGG